jgi:ribonuclease Z
MKVTILGNCANQTATNEGVAFIVDADEPILVDAGPGVVRQILRAGRSCTDIAHVFVTHVHGDHTLGFPYFLWNHFYEGLAGKKGPSIIRVYGLEETLRGLGEMTSYCYVPQAWPFQVEYHPVTGRSAALAVGGASVEIVEVEHTVPTIGLVFTSGGRKLAYSCDTIYSEAFVKRAKGADLMIHEGFATEELYELSQKVKHGTAADAGRAAKEAGATRLGLVHVFPPFLGRQAELVAEAKSHFSGEVFVEDELDTFSV